MLDTVLDALLGAIVVKAFVEELEPWRNDQVVEFVKASGGKNRRLRSLEGGGDKLVVWAGRIPRNKRRAAVRFSLDPTSGACDSTSDNVTSLDVAEALYARRRSRSSRQCHLRRDRRQRGLGALHCPMPVQHRTRAKVIEGRRKASLRPPTPISHSLAAINANGTVSPSHISYANNTY
ncbi:hypothetical protein M422DRAFT_260683 [Sphaerobolus stellatus SS14]|uniref:Uncharacterized protein n=1 Tax=Sphaerobolus stellatus (strain SS14) TaxID=990650 RepID=A0A0C9U1Z7_SPHS4|nr:hypothetical protein M422DRAFT_260683 [Sphaerobolus stellatus SS14]